MRSKKVLTLLALLLASSAMAHVGLHPSVHDTVAGIMDRMRKEVPAEQLVKMSVDQVLQLLTEEEKEILGSEHITFTANVPVVVSVMKQSGLDEPYWLAARGFEKTAFAVKVDKKDFEVWRKRFDPGNVGLGVNSISGNGDHYFVSIAPENPGDQLEISDIYPGKHTLGKMATGERVYVGASLQALAAVPAELEGQVLLRGDMDARRDAKLTEVFRLTLYPSSKEPDQVLLTWSGDPQTTQAVQWRTSTEVNEGAARYKKQGDSAWTEVQACTAELENISTVNDPIIHRHTARLRGLTAFTTYDYEVGDGSETGWRPGGTFTTAPAKAIPFKFVYMGDAQNGLDTWGKLVHKAYEKQPEAAFYIMAGDLVNRGAERDDWDELFNSAKGVYDHRQLVPCIGNHEYQGGEPNLYLSLFDLPLNGPDTIRKEKAYSFTYSNALFVVLDSNLEPDLQADWLDAQLADSKATWKFVVYHHPLYSSGARRDNPELRTIWGRIFDQYHVDLALQGHDHAYLRTYPMKGEQRVSSPAEGTIYIISVSGTKHYEQAQHDYTEVGFTNIATYQLLDIQLEGNKLSYKSYDIDGNVKDEFVIEK